MGMSTDDVDSKPSLIRYRWSIDLACLYISLSRDRHNETGLDTESGKSCLDDPGHIRRFLQCRVFLWRNCMHMDR